MAIRRPADAVRRLAAAVRRRRTARNAGAVLRSMWHDVQEDRILGLAAEAAFWTMLSLPSLLLALLGLVGYVGDALGPDLVDRIRHVILHAARDVLTAQTVQRNLTPLVDGILRTGSASIVSAGFVLSLWSGSTAVNTYVNTITVAYDMRGLRSAWRSRLLAFVLYLGALALGLVLLPLLLLGPERIIGLLPLSAGESRLAVAIIYWPAVVVLSIVALASLYHLAVPARTPWRRDLAGAVTAMLLWMLGSVLLRTFLRSSVRASAVYGPAGAPIAILLFFYVTALAVLVGAELNATIDALWPSEATAAIRGRARAREAAAAADHDTGNADDGPDPDP